MAIHHFDLLRMITGKEAVNVFTKVGDPSFSKYADEASAVITIEMETGLVVSYRGSWVSTGPETPWAGEWRIECRNGEISWASRADTGTSADQVVVRGLKKAPRRVELPELAQIDRAGTLAAFVRAIRTGQEPECSGRDNLGTLALMRAAIDAAETGQPQRVVAWESDSSA